MRESNGKAKAGVREGLSVEVTWRQRVSMCGVVGVGGMEGRGMLQAEKRALLSPKVGNGLACERNRKEASVA